MDQLFLQPHNVEACPIIVKQLIYLIIIKKKKYSVLHIETTIDINTVETELNELSLITQSCEN